LGKKLSKFDGNPSLAIPHVVNFLKYVSEIKVTHQVVLIELFLLSLGTKQREWVKHILSPRRVSYVKSSLKISSECGPHMTHYIKKTSRPHDNPPKEGLCSSPVQESEELIDKQEVE
jgi:hypothetical protein